MSRTLTTPFLLSLPLMLMLAGVASAQMVRTDYDKSLNFSKFHTYAWREHPILRNNPHIAETFSFALTLIRSEINRDLTSKKYTRAEGKPDFWVTVYVDAQVSDQVDGTFVIDVIDGSDDQLAWRSFCKMTVKDAEDRHKPIEKAVRKAMKRFPPKP